MRSTHRRLLALLGITAAVPLAEVLVLVLIRFLTAEGLAPQSTAVWPYDSYHDMRWLLVYHNTWLMFGAGLLALIALRGLLSATIVSLAWPARSPRPPYRALLLRNIGVAAFGAVLVLPFAAYAVAASVVSLSWFLFSALIPMLLLAPFLQRMSVGRAWWRGLPSIELVGWSLLDFAVITVGGALVWTTPEGWTPLVAAAVGALNGLLWRQTVHAAVLQQRVRWPRVPVVPIVVVLALAVPLASQWLSQPGNQANTFTPPIFTRPLPPRVPYAVILLAGHDSAYDGRPAADPNVELFSYVGLDPHGHPLSYRPNATHRSLESSAQLLAAQVEAVHRRTGRPIALIAQSEGVVVALTYLRNRPGPPVQALAMFSPLTRAGRTYYPPPDASTGWGLAAGWLLRVMFKVTTIGNRAASTPDEPFVRSLLDQAPFYRFHILCPIPGVRVVAFLPTVAAAEAPPGQTIPIPVVEVPTFHAGIIGRMSANDILTTFLAGAEVNHPRREFGPLQKLGDAWLAPTLAITLNPVWRPTAQPGPPFTMARFCHR
ncbi:hypothetical protein ONA91_26360 [Micromonospora sp. DR5-3]|uniref:hypothetical protein n=1 Tax=unclassified Micromonospora TaxID=2617518 RepID=UPI0011D62D3B|nr:MULTISPECIES: hypothetical protein [unclassified Micromonospora]MCW3817978.1 hypothetical protein [Micromonospora sp. DR5-3]TYC21430.1 hypothetical protein FXF52_26225 [Micromonospora sp. MP36]